MQCKWTTHSKYDYFSPALCSRNAILPYHGKNIAAKKNEDNTCK